MKKYSRKTKLILCMLAVLYLCGCTNTRPRTVSGNIAISESGIVEEDVLKQLKDSNSISVFTGESNGIKYEWTVFGSDIVKPHDLNMAIDIEKSDEDSSIAFEMKSTENFGFSSTLSIYLDERWDVLNAEAFSETDGQLTPAGKVSVTGKDSSILNFPMTETHGRYVIKAAESETSENTAATTSVTSKTVTSTETTVSTETTTATTVTDAVTTTTTVAVTTAESTEQPVEETEPENTEIPEDTQNYEEPEPEPEPETESERTYSDGSQTEQDKYLTDPIPEGMPMPVEPENAEVDNSKVMTCTFSIECTTILNNIADLEPEKLDVMTSDGIILSQRTVEFKEGESVFDVLQRVCQENNIHMEASWTPIYNSAYIEGINNLYEFDCGSLSGWMYRVNGWYPNYGCSRYQLAEGDVVEWRYTCDLGKDVGCEWMQQN